MLKQLIYPAFFLILTNSPFLFSAPSDETTFKIITSDEKEIEVPYRLLKLSGTIKSMIEDLGEGATELPIELPNVSREVFTVIIEVFTHIRDALQAGAAPEIKQNIAAKALEDVKLAELISAANYLDSKDVLNAALELLNERNLPASTIKDYLTEGRLPLEEFLSKLFKGRDITEIFNSLPDHMADDKKSNAAIQFILNGRTVIDDRFLEGATLPAGFTLTLPDSVTKIGWSFLFRATLPAGFTLTLPNSITEIGGGFLGADNRNGLLVKIRKKAG